MCDKFYEELKRICPECGETMDHFQRDGDMLAPEADWYVCPECGHQTDPE